MKGQSDGWLRISEGMLRWNPSPRGFLVRSTRNGAGRYGINLPTKLFLVRPLPRMMTTTSLLPPQLDQKPAVPRATKALHFLRRTLIRTPLDPGNMDELASGMARQRTVSSLPIAISGPPSSQEQPNVPTSSHPHVWTSTNSANAFGTCSKHMTIVTTSWTWKNGANVHVRLSRPRHRLHFA
ncbi:hypothetical protein BGY98DRAFT_157816 [Russula aff. rugulosa BPL654]|nr:hypothetical protein BGY98DRAFT_157816 [Russula aff. rugulosa BPL654]